MTTVYLDTCSLHRPFDDKSQMRVALEAEAILAVLTLCEQGALQLTSSDVLWFETNRNPHPQRKAIVRSIIAQAHYHISISSAIQERARLLEHDGFKPLDALHLTSAEGGNVDFFCTCDDRFLPKAKARSDLSITVVSPVELAQEVLP